MKLFRELRYWLLRVFIGKMSVIANVDISNWDFYSNLEKCKSEGKHYMFYGNHIYILEKRVEQQVFTGNKGKVSRRGNMFVLEEI